jgi:hypothetical protein
MWKRPVAHPQTRPGGLVQPTGTTPRRTILSPRPAPSPQGEREIAAARVAVFRPPRHRLQADGSQRDRDGAINRSRRRRLLAHRLVEDVHGGPGERDAERGRGTGTRDAERGRDWFLDSRTGNGDVRGGAPRASVRRHRRAPGCLWPYVAWIGFRVFAPCSLLNDCHPGLVNAYLRKCPHLLPR